MGENYGRLIHKDCWAAALPEIWRIIKINI
jgi:hypothetical protein